MVEEQEREERRMGGGAQEVFQVFPVLRAEVSSLERARGGGVVRDPSSPFSISMR